MVINSKPADDNLTVSCNIGMNVNSTALRNEYLLLSGLCVVVFVDIGVEPVNYSYIIFQTAKPKWRTRISGRKSVTVKKYLQQVYGKSN